MGIKPQFKTFTGNPYTYAWDANGQRRDLSADQRAVIFELANEGADKWSRKHGRPKGKRPSTRGPLSSAERNKQSAAALKAKTAGTNRPAQERATKLLKADRELALKVAHGEVKSTEAHRQLRKRALAGRVSPFPEGKNRVLVADPPWQYGDTREGLNYGAAADHFPTMSMDDLAALPVRDLAMDDAVLFCWATFPLLSKQIEVCEAWGFKYKTAFIWDKGRGGFGHYHGCQAEILLVLTRGSCVPESDTRENQIVRAPRGRHSAKPEIFRTIIDRMYPTGPRIELFRRGGPVEGWSVWGNEASEAAA